MQTELLRPGTRVWLPEQHCAGKVISGRRTYGCPAVHTVETEPSGRRMTVERVLPLPAGVTTLLIRG